MDFEIVGVHEMDVIGGDGWKSRPASPLNQPVAVRARYDFDPEIVAPVLRSKRMKNPCVGGDNDQTFAILEELFYQLKTDLAVPSRQSTAKRAVTSAVLRQKYRICDRALRENQGAFPAKRRGSERACLGFRVLGRWQRSPGDAIQAGLGMMPRFVASSAPCLRTAGAHRVSTPSSPNSVSDLSTLSATNPAGVLLSQIRTRPSHSIAFYHCFAKSVIVLHC